MYYEQDRNLWFPSDWSNKLNNKEMSWIFPPRCQNQCLAPWVYRQKSHVDYRCVIIWSISKQGPFTITKTRLFKYIGDFTSKNWNFSDKKKNYNKKKNKNYIFRISAQNIDCGYSLEPPRHHMRCHHAPISLRMTVSRSNRRQMI